MFYRKTKWETVYQAFGFQYVVRHTRSGRVLRRTFKKGIDIRYHNLYLR